jgi:2'-deoxymugineic-acid 2'-dioxygenase/mugineic-acid 3-dioxygenase
MIWLLPCREVIETFTVQTRDMGMELLRLLCQGMGLRSDYFHGSLGGADVIVTLNHYPACPDPSTMIGLPPHCDRNLLSLLLPSTVPGLQFSHNGEWIDVVPLPNAFIVNFGLPLEVTVCRLS